MRETAGATIAALLCAARIRLAAAGFALAVAGGVASAQDVAPHAIDIPAWFTETFLDFREDIRDAARDKRRLMVYFGQDGCPYCRQLMVTNFSQRGIVEKTRRHFVAIALNLWGDRETKWLDGRVRSEKALARFLDVQFTPTLLFFDERGAVVARLNGYYPPHRFEAVLDYVAGKRERKETLAAYLARQARDPASPRLADEPFFAPPPHDLRRAAGGKPLAVLFETTHCGAVRRAASRRVHAPAGARAAGALRRRPVRARRAHAADHARRPGDDGAGMGGRARRDLRADHRLFRRADGREVFRIDAYLRPFHVESSLDYVASGAYRDEPSFQRFIQERAERLRAAGGTVDLWK